MKLRVLLSRNSQLFTNKVLELHRSQVQQDSNFEIMSKINRTRERLGQLRSSCRW